MFNLNNINSWIKILFILKDLEDLRQLHSLDIFVCRINNDRLSKFIIEKYSILYSWLKYRCERKMKKIIKNILNYIDNK